MQVQTNAASWLRRASALLLLPLLLACANGPGGAPSGTWAALTLGGEARAMYASRRDGDLILPAIPAKYLTAENIRRTVPYYSDHAPGTIVVDPWQMYLYLVQDENEAIRYRIGVGEAGRQFSGRARVAMKKEWPTWTPTANMLRTEPALYRPWAGGMEGGLNNPLGARALYLYRNGRDTLYRIHGTYAPWSVGRAISAGCIRLFNHDSIHLYERVEEGARVIVLTEDEAGQGTVLPGSPLVLDEPGDIPVLDRGA
jgi:lipoprotein-anchoring transpeptidase ErfK/SrfK